MKSNIHSGPPYLAAIVATMLLFCAAQALEAGTIEFSAGATKIPGPGLEAIALPGWLIEQTGLAHSEIKEGHLEITTEDEGSLIYKLANQPQNEWKSSPTAVVEARIRILEQTSRNGAFNILFSNGLVTGVLNVGTNHFRLGSEEFQGGFDFTRWTTFRIVLRNWDTAQPEGDLYVGNEKDPVATLDGDKVFVPASSNHQLRFGDASSTPGGVSGKTQIEYFTWSDKDPSGSH